MIIIYSVSLNFTNLSPLLFSSSFFLIHLAHHSHLMASATSCPSIPCFLSILLLLLTSTHVAAQAQSSPPTPQQTPNSQYGYFNQSSFNPSMAIVIIVLIAVFFFLGFFSIYVRQCAGEGITGTGPNNTQLPTAIRRPKGLDPEIIESLPTMVYSEVKEHKIGKGALECAVCLSEFEDDETLRLLPKCSHVFHHDCIDAWFAGHATCPVCRYNLSDYKKGDIPSLDTMTADSQNPPPETVTEITRQAEDRPVDPPSLPTDAVVLEVRPETEAERTEREEAEELERIASRRRALRSKSSRRPVRFPRSHSTGHSLSSNNESNTERYTLRIPDHVLRQIIADGKLKRTTSLLFFGESAGEGSCRPVAANRTPGGEGSSRGGRSGSVRMFVRNLSERFSAWGMGRKLSEGEEGSLKGNGGSFKGGRLGGVRVPFDCLAGGEKEVAESGRGMAER